MPDAIVLLRNDHKDVEKLFKKFEKLGDNAHKTKRDVVDQVIEMLAVHAVIEEQVFYPAVRAAVEEMEQTVLEGLEEHHIVKWTLDELEGMHPEHERFEAKVTVLIESVRHHVEEEEGDLFPAVRDVMGRKELRELGDAMEAARKAAPKRPHPKAPDTPPGNVIAGAGAVVVDEARNAARKAARTVVGR